MTRRRLFQWIAPASLISAVVLNSGCILTSPREWINNGFKVGPNYCKPPAPVADALVARGTPGAGGWAGRGWTLKVRRASRAMVTGAVSPWNGTARGLVLRMCP